MSSLLEKIANSIKWRILNPLIKIVGIKNQFFNFYLTNIKALLSNKVFILDGSPRCNQKLLITGGGSVVFGSNCIFGYKLGGRYHFGLIEIQPRYNNSKIEFGKNVTTNNNLFLCCANQIIIGENTLIGEDVTILDHEAHNTDPNKRNEIGDIGSVEIGKNVWIGNNVIILKNTQIGNNSIVAAGAIVSGFFPENVILGGIPAKIIKKIN